MVKIYQTAWMKPGLTDWFYLADETCVKGGPAFG